MIWRLLGTFSFTFWKVFYHGKGSKQKQKLKSMKKLLRRNYLHLLRTYARVHQVKSQKSNILFASFMPIKAVTGVIFLDLHFWLLQREVESFLSIKLDSKDQNCPHTNFFSLTFLKLSIKEELFKLKWKRKKRKIISMF